MHIGGCALLPDLANGKILYNARGRGSIAYHKCNSGYRVVGDEIRECGGNMEWTGSETYCVKQGIAIAIAIIILELHFV